MPRQLVDCLDIRVLHSASLVVESWLIRPWSCVVVCRHTHASALARRAFPLSYDTTLPSEFLELQES